MKKYNFFALVGRLRWINRWSLMRNSFNENVAEHSWETSVIAHALAVIGNKCFDGDYDANKIAVSMLFHDAEESLTGDIPTPIKKLTDSIRQSHKELETHACKILTDNLPKALKSVYKGFICVENCEKTRRLKKGADLISAYIKCTLEENSGNKEFSGAKKTIQKSLADLNLLEVNYFMEHFVPAYGKNLDELIK